MSTPERTMATTTGVAGSATVTGAAMGTTVAAMLAAAFGFIVGLLFGMGSGEEKGYWRGMGQ
jgi:hypothetical protein